MWTWTWTIETREGTREGTCVASNRGSARETICHQGPWGDDHEPVTLERGARVERDDEPHEDPLTALRREGLQVRS
jgi:hypothetical protein